MWTMWIRCQTYRNLEETPIMWWLNFFLIKCEVCGYTFSSLRNLRKHMGSKHEGKRFLIKVWSMWLYIFKPDKSEDTLKNKT